MFAHVTDGTVDQIGAPPALTFQDGRWFDLRPREASVLATCGWFEVTETEQPETPEDKTLDLSYEWDGSQVSQVWTPRDWTEHERAQQAQITDLQERVAALEALVLAQNPPDPDGVPWEPKDWPPGAVVTHDGHVWTNQTGVWLNALCEPGDPLHPFWSQNPDEGDQPVPWQTGMHLTPGLFVTNGGHLYQYAGTETATAPANWAPTGTVSTAAWTYIGPA